VGLYVTRSSSGGPLCIDIQDVLDGGNLTLDPKRHCRKFLEASSANCEASAHVITLGMSIGRRRIELTTFALRMRKSLHLSG
jgi:hypothetical protein